MIDVVVKGISEIIRHLERTEMQNLRDVNSAFRIEGFRLKNLLQKQIREGAPGGKPFQPLSILSRYWGGRKRGRTAKPLSRLAYGVRYYVPNTSEPRLQVGYVGPVSRSEVAAMTNTGLRFSSMGGFRGIQESKMTSASWRRIASKHQAGFTRVISPAQRGSMWHSADEVPRRYAKVFAGAANTRYTFTSPSRPIIDPFWAQQEAQTVRNIKSNYYRLSAGMRV